MGDIRVIDIGYAKKLFFGDWSEYEDADLHLKLDTSLDAATIEQPEELDSLMLSYCDTICEHNQPYACEDDNEGKCKKLDHIRKAYAAGLAAGKAGADAEIKNRINRVLKWTDMTEERRLRWIWKIVNDDCLNVVCDSADGTDKDEIRNRRDGA